MLAKSYSFRQTWSPMSSSYLNPLNFWSHKGSHMGPDLWNTLYIKMGGGEGHKKNHAWNLTTIHVKCTNWQPKTLKYSLGNEKELNTISFYIYPANLGGIPSIESIFSWCNCYFWINIHIHNMIVAPISLNKKDQVNAGRNWQQMIRAENEEKYFQKRTERQSTLG